MNNPPQEQGIFDVIGVGTVVVDHVITLSGELAPDTKHEAASHHLQVGGPVPTALVLLQRWGLKTSFVGGWSDDAHGELIDADLGREGVHAGFALREPGRSSGFAHVWLDPVNATRTIAFRRATWSWSSWETSQLPLHAARLLHLDGWPSDPLPGLVRKAKSCGCLISLDTGSVKPGMDELIPELDVLNASRGFIRSYLGVDDGAEGARLLAARGPRWVTVTDGSNGAWIATPEGVLHQSAYPIKAVDTTGAGDTFSAGLIYGVLQGWAPDRIVRIACAAAALKCSALGNRDALPTLSAVMTLAQQDM